MASTSDRAAGRRGPMPALALAFSFVGASVLAGCSSAAGGTVKVTLTEWAVVADKASISAGEVTFDVSNAGTQFKHEFVVMKTDLAPDALPADSTGKVDESAAGLSNVGEAAEMEPGASKTLALNVKPGKYVLICNIVEAAGNHESHYLKGMRIAFTVS
jgi:uncharacterized cupredoxin-like copper-binding protein